MAHLFHIVPAKDDGLEWRRAAGGVERWDNYPDIKKRCTRQRFFFASAEN